MADQSPDLVLELPKDLLASRSASRGELVYQALLEAIRNGKLLPGYRIREEEIAAMLGVSRTPVREAIQQLQSRRLVEYAPGRGIAVLEMNRQQILELYAIREVLEGAAARLAAQHADADEIEVMKSLLDELTAAGSDSTRLARLNIALHRVIYEAARNRYVQDALANLQDALSLLGATTFSVPDRFDSANVEHRAIVAAIEARDPDEAERTARLHIREAQRARLKLRM